VTRAAARLLRGRIVKDGHGYPEGPCDGVQQALARAIPFRRVAEPAEIADAVLFFASGRAGYITGQVLSVSGGLTMAG
jgi:NAD(P)-dependent dehydrogenase (short-subunit alcohol dehydrogenase family)